MVENRPGAGGRIVAESMKNAPADGSVLMLTPIVVPVLAPMVFAKLPYDPAVDFAPVAHVANFQFALGVNGTHPAKSMKELVAWYKANPAKANFGSPAPGSLPHFFGVMIGKGAGIDLIHVPYNGGAPMMNAPDGRPGQLGASTPRSSMIELHRAGKIRILGDLGSDAQPAPARGADLRANPVSPASKAPAGSRSTRRRRRPRPTVRQLNAAINKALAAPELRERFTKLGLEPTGGSAADLAKRMADDTARWGPIVKASGFKAD